jgi:phage terminase small subunit
MIQVATAPSNLTPKQERFVQEYLVDLNAKQAAIRAGYSPRRAKQTGSRLVTNGDISREIDRRNQAIADKLELDAERVMQTLAAIAFVDIRKFFDGGRLKPVAELDPHCAAALQSIEATVDPDGEVTKKIRLKDSIRALELLGKRLGLWNGPEETTQTGGTVLILPSNGKMPWENKN